MRSQKGWVIFLACQAGASVGEFNLKHSFTTLPLSKGELKFMQGIFDDTFITEPIFHWATNRPGGINRKINIITLAA